MATLLENIQEDLKKALKEKKEFEVLVLRLLIAAIKDKEIQLNKRGKLTDEEVVGVVQKQVKQRKESVTAYQKGNRDDLADKESKEIKFLSKYLPQQISPQELEKITKEAIQKTKASSPQDFGKVMGMVMGMVKGRAEGNQVAQVVKKALGQG